MSFDDLWDPNSDRTFGDGILGKSPEFWGDRAGAFQAAQATIDALGTTGITTRGAISSCCDGFLIPYADATSTFSAVAMARDASSDLASDFLDPGCPDCTYGASAVFNWVNNGYPWASFDAAAGAAPLPFTPALLLAGWMAAIATRRVR